MFDPNEPLDYRHPQTSDEVRTGRNFAMGLLCGVAASGAAWLVALLARDGRVFLLAFASVELGKIGFAIATSRDRRRRGMAPGLLVSLGLALLVYGGLCFYALQNI